MSYLLDSDVVIDLLGNDQATERLLEQLSVRGVSISVISCMEVSQGLHRHPGVNRARYEALINSFSVLPVDLEIAERCAALRASLTIQRKSVRPRSLDLLIAATAIEHNLTLVTRNYDDYKDLPGLTIYR